MAEINAALVIPSLDPDAKILRVIGDAVEAGFAHVILVDDGSDQAHKCYFEQLDKEYSRVTLLVHPQNRGKGEALKTAFRYYRENLADQLDGVVTADGDGQHTTADIVHCTEEMMRSQKVVFGCRDFTLPDVPKKSRFGNHTTSLVFKLACGMTSSDTQTGLRAFPNQYLDAMIGTAGSRFEYETNMILEMKRRDIPLQEVKIETVYEDNNSGTHFHPIKDSVRIYKLILKYMLRYHQGLKYALSSGCCFVLDFLINYFVLLLIHHAVFGGDLQNFLQKYEIFIAYGTARVISSLANFTINRTLVFRSNAPVGKSLLKYYALCIPQATIGAVSVRLLSALLQTTAPFLNSLLKFAVDICLFFISFFIQRKWVFRKKKK